MKKYHKILVESINNKTIGNHKIDYNPFNNEERDFYYHNNLVCIVNDFNKTFELFDCGYGNYKSTKDCLSGYREYFSKLGYTQINPKPIYKYEM